MSPFRSLVLFAIAFLLASPAAATLVLSRTTLVPPSLPLVPGQDLSADAVISIIPSGARTFPGGHSLQMETDLVHARWNTIVLTDGIPADRESGEGSVMFINGVVLSYPTDRDVALEVIVNGTVPEGINPVTVLTIHELDNSGVPVPGSTITITEPVSALAAPAPTTTRVATPPSPSPSPSPTRASGWTWPVASIAACGAAVACLHAREKSR